MTTETPTSTFERLGFALLAAAHGLVVLSAAIGLVVLWVVCLRAFFTGLFS